MKKITQCPACNEYVQPLTPIIDTINTVNRLKCLDCGAIFFEYDMQEASQYDADYNAHFVRYGDIKKAIYYSRLLETTALIFPEEPEILEIGPGSGLIMLELTGRGLRIEGVEKDRSTADRLQKDHGLPVRCGGLECLTNEKKWDIIFSSHVIEHWTSPKDFLKHCTAHIEDHGIIIINTPCADYAKGNPANWHHCKTRQQFEHCCLLTKKALTLCAQECSLEILNYMQHDKYESMDMWLTPKNKLFGGVVS